VKLLPLLDLLAVLLDFRGDRGTTLVTIFREWQTDVANSRRCFVFWHQVSLVGNVNK
jgi:hypothetical protein